MYHRKNDRYREYGLPEFSCSTIGKKNIICACMEELGHGNNQIKRWCTLPTFNFSNMFETDS